MANVESLASNKWRMGRVTRGHWTIIYGRLTSRCLGTKKWSQRWRKLKPSLGLIFSPLTLAGSVFGQEWWSAIQGFFVVFAFLEHKNEIKLIYFIRAICLHLSHLCADSFSTVRISKYAFFPVNSTIYFQLCFVFWINLLFHQMNLVFLSCFLVSTVPWHCSFIFGQCFLAWASFLTIFPCVKCQLSFVSFLYFFLNLQFFKLNYLF